MNNKKREGNNNYMQKKSKKFLELQALRKRCEITQTEMAKLIGCGQGNYSAKELGSISFSLEECYIIKNTINKKLEKSGREPLSMEDIFLR